MRKKLLSVVVILLIGAWASAQQPQPGYAFLTSNPKTAGSAIVVPTAGVPPEPGAVGGTPAAGNWNPSYGYPMGPGSIGPTPIGAGGGYPMGPMGPSPMGSGAGMPTGPVPGPGPGAGYPGMAGPSFALDPPSSFGTETVWVNASYLYGWMTRANLSTALVTVGSGTDTRTPGRWGSPEPQLSSAKINTASDRSTVSGSS